jgi:hypothetical protein
MSMLTKASLGFVGLAVYFVKLDRVAKGGMPKTISGMRLMSVRLK